jgi:hypothetical protein
MKTMSLHLRSSLIGLLFALSLGSPRLSAALEPSKSDSDIPATFTQSSASHDYAKREVMIPMRDGVRLYTVIIVPNSAHETPILLTRTPYNAAQHVKRIASLQ